MWEGSVLNVLYRFFGEGGVLLYVGRSCRLENRLSAHSKEKPWGEVARIGLAHFDSADELARAEIEAIRKERPAWNKVHVRKMPRVDPPADLNGWRPIETAAEVLGVEVDAILLNSGVEKFRVSWSASVMVDGRDVASAFA